VYGYERDTSPNLARIFADGARFERAYAAASYTPTSTASLLTGQLPQSHGVRLFNQIFPEESRLIPELLPPQYQSAAFVGTAILSDGATGMASRFDHFDDTLDLDERFDIVERKAGKLTDAVLEWLRNDRDRERPLFLWVHYKDPHAPYAPPRELEGRFHYAVPLGWKPGARIWPGTRLEEADDPLYYVDRYDEEILYVDREIGRLLDGYAKLAALDDALLIVTADHGETLTERRQWFTHAYHVWEEIARVPLLMRGPGVKPGEVDDLASGIDIAPTVLGFVGAPIPASLPGVDLRVPGAIGPDRTVFVESVYFLRRQMRAAIRGHRKWVARVSPDPPHVRGVMSFDLAIDPLERAPAAAEDTQRPVRQLLELVREDPNPGGSPEGVESGTLNENLLRKLGYVE
jgi:arylsulfatase A-like enzyme